MKVGHFNVRLVRQGERYGRRDALTHDKPSTMIEFFDSRHPDPDSPAGLGQFVNRYYLSTLLSDHERRGPTMGLNMHGGVPAWKRTADELRAACAWAREQEYPIAAGALRNIQKLLSGNEWDSDTLGAVAEIMRAAGYEIREFEP